jgi:uncharacterized protein (DUF2126 family)
MSIPTDRSQASQRNFLKALTEKMNARRAKNQLSVFSNCAQAIESHLSEQGIVLTMGGEPTFLPQQPAGSEWSVDALGPQKLGYARRMAAAMIAGPYPGALAMQVFGKWYPGEALPRWNFLLLHTNDGDPLWPATNCLHLDDTVPAKNRRQPLKATANSIAKALGLKAFLQPAYEQGTGASDKPSAWVLPLSVESNRWVSESWQFPESDRIELLIGDSPAGLRIPFFQLPDTALKRALTIEEMDGTLAVFIPPLEWPDFRQLLSLLAKVAQNSSGRNWVFCGYGPSEAGNALTTYGLAADPGVLEVNLPPADNWLDYAGKLATVHKAATQVDLVTVKCHLNGVVRGTGGGSHLAFGGPPGQPNPFLSHPRWISSILRYWQHHPALSYAFTGQYVGPGSQAPRVDEGPVHGLYELEVACEGLERLAAPAEGELVDQFLRNLLTDSAGNTHRAELCFDKFANPITSNGKLGIIELRAFETQPDCSWMAAIALFIRAVFTRLLIEPFDKPLRRWGPLLHDRYFLPALLWQDIESMVAELNALGLPFNSGWLRPAFDFRFPEVGQLPIDGGVIHIRQALESWPLMAEESRDTATVRVVDNSTDRLELEWSGESTLPNGTLLVNGIVIDWKQADGKVLRGLRYKCASAYPALHPHVPIQSPLRFEWIPNGRVKPTAAALYHYWNPHGPTYVKMPASINEARKRSAERWQIIPPEKTSRTKGISACVAPEFDFTIDLRRATSPTDHS